MKNALEISACIACLRPGSNASQSCATRFAEHILKIPYRYFRNAAVQIGRTAFEDAAHDDYAGRERAVTPAAEKRYLVPDIDAEIPCKNGADDNIRRVAVGEVITLDGKPRDARDAGFEFRLDAEYLDAVGAVFAGRKSKGGTTSGDGL
jgi:hypothetical protein